MKAHSRYMGAVAVTIRFLIFDDHIDQEFEKKKHLRYILRKMHLPIERVLRNQATKKSISLEIVPLKFAYMLDKDTCK